jgi:hypothetical protein
MSQESCREHPTRCGLRDTVRERSNAMKRTARWRSLERVFWREIVTAGYARALFVGSAQAAAGSPTWRREKQKQIPRLLAAVAETRNDNDNRQHAALQRRSSMVLPALVSSPALLYTAAMRRIRSSCSALLSAPMVMASSTPRFSAYLSASS